VLSAAARLRELAAGQIEPQLLTHIAQRLNGFPAYAQVRRVAVIPDPWSVENGCMTPTLKLRRERILETHRMQVDALYAGH